MWNRSDLKRNAKSLLRRPNYWLAVVVALISGVLTGNANLNFNFFDGWDAFSSGFDESLDSSINYNSHAFFKNFMDSFSHYFNVNSPRFTTMILGFGFVFIFTIIFSVLLSIFILNPLAIGCQRWFIISRTDAAPIGEIGYTFKNGYINVVKIEFLRNLFIFLWSCLFVIPGIIKSYEYRMIPYLLAENPDMDYDEAFRRSREMMDGNKWDAFVLDLSFIGWIMLGGIFGIVAILFVLPYRAYTNVELYVALCCANNSSDTSAYSADKFNDRTKNVPWEN